MVYAIACPHPPEGSGMVALLLTRPDLQTPDTLFHQHALNPGNMAASLPSARFALSPCCLNFAGIISNLREPYGERSAGSCTGWVNGDFAGPRSKISAPGRAMTAAHGHFSNIEIQYVGLLQAAAEINFRAM